MHWDDITETDLPCKDDKGNRCSEAYAVYTRFFLRQMDWTDFLKLTCWWNPE